MDETMECALMRTLVQETTLGLGGAVEAGDWPRLSPPPTG
jgi:hypothetical protein